MVSPWPERQVGVDGLLRHLTEEPLVERLGPTARRDRLAIGQHPPHATQLGQCRPRTPRAKEDLADSYYRPQGRARMKCSSPLKEIFGI